MICRDIREVICSSIIADHHPHCWSPLTVHPHCLPHTHTHTQVLVTHRIPISIGLLKAALCQDVQEDMQGVLSTPHELLWFTAIPLQVIAQQVGILIHRKDNKNLFIKLILQWIKLTAALDTKFMMQIHLHSIKGLYHYFLCVILNPLCHQPWVAALQISSTDFVLFQFVQSNLLRSHSHLYIFFVSLEHSTANYSKQFWDKVWTELVSSHSFTEIIRQKFWDL